MNARKYSLLVGALPPLLLLPGSDESSSSVGAGDVYESLSSSDSSVPKSEPSTLSSPCWLSDAAGGCCCWRCCG